MPPLLYFETVTLERVFDVHRWRAIRYAPAMTNFSFECAGKRRFSVPVLGWPSIEPGTRLTAALRKAGNWQTLVGWVNHSNGEIVLPDTTRDRAKILLFIPVMVMCWISALVVDDAMWRRDSVVAALLVGASVILASRNLRKTKAYIREITRLANPISPGDRAIA